MINILDCIRHEHDLSLVALSAIVCLVGCLATASLLAQSRTEGRPRPWWLLGAAGLFGASVWSLHFVAMLAFLRTGAVAYAVEETTLSIAVAVSGSAVAFLVWMRGGPIAVAASGVVLGATIGAMHYLGVAAMRTTGLILIDQGHVAASVGIGMVFGWLALLRAKGVDGIGKRVEVATLLAVAVCGLHFVGMAGLTIAPGEMPSSTGLIGTAGLGMAVGSVSVGILTVFLLLLLLNQHLSQRNSRELARMRLLADLAHEALFIHRDGLILEMNVAGSRMTGLSFDDVVDTSIIDLFAAEEQPALTRRAQCRSADLEAEEFTIVTSDDRRVPVELSCQLIEYKGKPATAVALRDMTARKLDEARTRHLSLHDPLTDLANRSLLEARLNNALSAAANTGGPAGVIYLDFDRFKPVNDVHGHRIGDGLLVQAGKRMMAVLGPTDTLARVGGDEFVAVLAPPRSPSVVADVAQALVDALHRPFVIEGVTVEIGASAGVSMCPDDGSTPHALLNAADTALNRVKDEGRGTFRFYEPAMDAELQARRVMERELGGAIDREELVLFYQPLVNARTGAIETFEALVRWDHPTRGMVSPAEFIPLAEQTGLIARLGEWVIDKACETAAAWPSPWRVSVNVSPGQFSRSDVPRIVRNALARHALPASRLVVEITESVFIQDAGKAVETLTALRLQGIRLALDDFGSGYSSLGYLQRFKFDKIKIDQCFVRKLVEDADTLTIMRAMVNLGHNLGLQVTVEGVETRNQARILQALGCDQMQGYLFARPAKHPATSDREQARILELLGLAGRSGPEAGLDLAPRAA